MTVCIGAICDNGKTAIIASDRMVTSHYPPIEFEHTKSKINKLTDYCLILCAGNALRPIEIIVKTRDLIKGNERPPSIEMIVEKAKELYQFLRTKGAEEIILKPRALSIQTFYERGARILPPELFNIIDNEISRHNLEVELLIVGVDEKAHIYTISNPGVANCFDTIGFHAIGVGYLHAIQIFIAYEYDISYALNEAINIVYSAKKAAEAAPGVGRKTDIALIIDNKVLDLTKDVIGELDKIHKTVRKSPGEIRQESNKLLDDYLGRVKEEDNEKK